jgi:cytochrome c oxidase subunit II
MRLFLLVLVLAVIALAVERSRGVADDAVISIEASDFQFSPSTLVLHAGVPATLRLESVEGVHGFASEQLGVETTLLRPGHPVTLTVVAKAPGQFLVHCAHICGLGHAGMQLAVDVEP